MGFRISYVVAPILPKDIVGPLGFQLGIETDALPYEEWWVGTLKSNNQTVFWAEAEDFADDVVNELTELSDEFDIITCRVNEDRERAQAVCYRGNRIKWRVEVSPEKQVIATGALPTFFQGIVTANASKPFMIATETAASMTGFNHETDLLTSAFTRIFRVEAGRAIPEQHSSKGIVSRLLKR